YDGPISGFFGELTEAAVIQFQQSQGLTADGIVGPTTAEALRAADSGGDPNRGESGTGALRRGDLGQRVTQLQQRLADLGFYSGAVDGDFGEATEAAVQRFQTARGLTVDGLVGSATQAALEQPAPQPADSSDSATRTPDPNDGLLERSESGDAVADLQRRLATLNYYDGPIDGSYGPQTEEAVSQFQADNNLATDGVAGPATLAAIEQSPAPVAEAPSGEPTATSQPVPEVASDSPVDNADNPAENSASNAPIEAVPIQPASPVVPTETAVVLPVRVDLSPEDIRVMQARLKDRGFYDGPVDGVLNDATREAIAAAQQAYEVSPGDLVISE
ncbi:MAG: peptidoglycan-binding protein, partial [Cyanobacteria bacterium P01_A01_bin.135]